MILLIVLSLITSAELTVESEPKIVGGNTIPIAEAPYQVSLRLIVFDSIRFGSGFFCGGCLISSSMVLTAAHCMFDGNDPRSPSSLQIVGGHADLFGRDSNTFVSAVSSFKTHDLYAHGKSLGHDIALIKLKSQIKSSRETKAINLPTTTYPVDSTCLISGWGKTEWEGTKSQLLRGAHIPVNNPLKCNLPQYLNGSVTSGMLCAGSFAGGTNVCQGDSGGPLTCNDTVYGITSHGIGCAFSMYPAVFTDVFYYRDWIIENKSYVHLSNLKIVFSAIFIALTNTIANTILNISSFE